MNLPLWACLVIMALAMAFAHLFRWPRTLPRLAAYSIGTAIIWVGVLLYRHDLELLWFPTVAGLTTFLLWGWDAFMRWLADVYQDWMRGRRDQRSDSADSMDV